jgi:hypothetical protein
MHPQKKILFFFSWLFAYRFSRSPQAKKKEQDSKQERGKFFLEKKYYFNPQLKPKQQCITTITTSLIRQPSRRTLIKQVND